MSDSFEESPIGKLGSIDGSYIIMRCAMHCHFIYGKIYRLSGFQAKGGFNQVINLLARTFFLKLRIFAYTRRF